MKENKKNIIMLLLAIVFFSTMEVVSKTMAMVPMQITFLRFLIGGLILIPFAVRDIKGRGIKLTAGDFGVLLLLGILNVCMSMNFLHYGIHYADANIAAIVFCSNPLFTSLFSAIFLGEKMTVKKAMGLIIGLVGVFVSFSNKLTASQNTYLLGIGLSLAAAVTFALYITLGKKITKRLGSVSVSSFTSVFGSVVLVPIMLFFGASPLVSELMPNLGQVLYLSVFVTGLAYYLYFKALENLDTGLGSMSFFLKPILASVLAAVVLGETVCIQIVLGIVLVLAGIVLAVRPAKTLLRK